MSIQFGTNGAIPSSPATLLAQLIAGVQATNPGYTADLPGTLIEDIASTCVMALTIIDQARVDAVNSVTPYSASPFVIAQLGEQFGIVQGTPTNTSVYLTFEGTPGYIVPAGFQVSDGSYTYQTMDASTVQTNGYTGQVYAVALASGTWAVPANTVTQFVTSFPSGYLTSVTNAIAGIPSVASESNQSYQSRVIQAGQIAVQGVAGYIQTLVQAVPGVTPRLVTVLQVSGGWEVICGGGDPYAIAGAIYQGVLDLSTIIGSATTARNITTTITDYPNSYSVTYVNPPQQTVTGTVTWNTTLTNFASSSQVDAAGATALANYINGITVGQPINEFEMTAAFQNAVALIIPLQYLTRLVFSISVNGTVTAPTSGTGIIPGDPESYFYAAVNAFTVAQG